MGGVHRLVLQRRAPSLAMFYPSVGGCGAPDEAWPAFRGVLADHVVELRRRLDQAPQTNEVGRASALMGELQHLASARPGPFGSSRSARCGGASTSSVRALVTPLASHTLRWSRVVPRQASLTSFRFTCASGPAGMEQVLGIAEPHGIPTTWE